MSDKYQIMFAKINKETGEITKFAFISILESSHVANFEEMVKDPSSNCLKIEKIS